MFVFILREIVGPVNVFDRLLRKMSTITVGYEGDSTHVPVVCVRARIITSRGGDGKKSCMFAMKD